MLAGEAVKDLVAELGIRRVTLYKWRRQALIDAGRAAGRQELRGRSARCRPAGASKSSRPSSRSVKAASALFEEGAADPKGSSRLSEG